ncbi:MAG: hypothetical protein H0V30_05265, partial [Chitinophagaceae bacterium]|nr:hypothetical protein [Chitinophagaceae bacterium]
PNSIMVVENLKQSNTSFGIFRENVLSGYIIYNSKTKRMQQFGIDKNHRKKYLAKQLFNHIAKHFELILPLSISRLMQPVQLN